MLFDNCYPHSNLNVEKDFFVLLQLLLLLQSCLTNSTEHWNPEVQKKCWITSSPKHVIAQSVLLDNLPIRLEVKRNVTGEENPW